MNKQLIQKLLLISLLFPSMLAARNPFVWDDKIKSIDSGVALPSLEGISADCHNSSSKESSCVRLAVVHHQDKRYVVEEGERVGQWKIRAIRNDSVVLQGLDGRTYTISLHLDDV